MTILTIIKNANDVIIYFENPLERGFEYIRLISCSFYNSWYNLKEKGEIGFTTALQQLKEFLLEIILSVPLEKSCRDYLVNKVSQSNLMTQAVQLSSKIHRTEKFCSIVT